MVKNSEQHPDQHLTAQQLASILMLSERRVQQLAREGVLVKEGRGRYPLVTNVQGYIRYWQDRAIGSREPGEPADYHTEKTRLVRAQATKAELEAAQMCGELIPAAVVLETWQAKIAAARAQLLSLPSKAAPVVASETDQTVVETTLKRLVHEALNELAGSGMPSDFEARLKTVASDLPSEAGGGPRRAKAGGQSQN